MMAMICKFACSLLLTLGIELPAAFSFRARKMDLLLALLVNILTNPAVVLFSTLMGDRLCVQIILETVVILVEGCYYKKYSLYIKRPFLCSLCCNIASYSFGLLVNGL